MIQQLCLGRMGELLHREMGSAHDRRTGAGKGQAGKLKALGIAAPKRHPLLPEIRTLAEQGVPGVDTDNWYALFAPAKTP